VFFLQDQIGICGDSQICHGLWSGQFGLGRRLASFRFCAICADAV